MGYTLGLENILNILVSEIIEFLDQGKRLRKL